MHLVLEHCSFEIDYKKKLNLRRGSIVRPGKTGSQF